MIVSLDGQHCDDNIRADQDMARMVVAQCGVLRRGQKHVHHDILSLLEMHLTASLFVVLRNIMYNMHAIS